jgi:hypothetical protein
MEFHGLDDKQKQCNSVLTRCDSVVKKLIIRLLMVRIKDVYKG